MQGMIWNSDGSRDVTSDVPTPLYYKDHFYVLSDVSKKVSKVEAQSGKILWTVKLPSKKKWRGSPTASDNKIYMMNHGGTVIVLDANDGKTLLETNMGEDKDDNIRSSIPIVDSQLFIRTNHHLYCIEKS
jgi:outer membrane protein assembly factor BamB